MRDLAIENLFLSFNLSCFLSVYFNFGGQMVDKKIKKLPIQRPRVPKKERILNINTISSAFFYIESPFFLILFLYTLLLQLNPYFLLLAL